MNMNFRLISKVLMLIILATQSVALIGNCTPPKKSVNALSSSLDIIKNFQSGSSKLVKYKDAQRYNFYNISLYVSSNISYEFALSVQNIYSFLPANGLDFFVNGILVGSHLQIILVMDVTAKWGWTEVFYIVSSRSDFSVGMFVADNDNLLMSKPNSTTLNLTYTLPNKFEEDNQFLYAIPFISGLRSYDYNLNLTFISTDYNSANNLLSIQIQISYDLYPLQSLYLSYLIFNMASELEVTSVSNLTQIPSNVNIFVGVSGINPLFYAFKSINTTAKNISGLLTASPVSQQTFNMVFGIDGIIVQTQQSMDLLFQSPKIKNMSSNIHYCISKARCNSLHGITIFEQSDVYSINSKCVICTPNSDFNEEQGSCICRKNYILINQACISLNQTCGVNEEYKQESNNCTCLNFYVNISGQCTSIFDICPAGKVYYLGRCMQIKYSNKIICDNESILIKDSCQRKVHCNLPFVANSLNQCECPKGSQLKNSSCVPCSVNQTWTRNKCVCKDSFFKIGNACLSCNQNAYFNGTACVCLNNFTGNGYICTPQSTNSAKLSSSAPSGYFGGSITIP